MLADLENKFGAIVSEGLRARTHLDVAVGAPLAPQAGRCAVGVAVAQIAPESGFSPFDRLLVGPPDAPQSRRLLPISFVTNIVFLLRPSEDTSGARREARALILEYVSATAHLLSGPDVMDGSAFAGTDHGFLVDRLSLGSGVSAPELEDGLFAATLSFKGVARIWPVGAAQKEGVIKQLDAVIASLPLLLTVDRSPLMPEAQARVSGALGRLRRVGGDGNSESASVAVTVQADVPIDDRGTILDSVEGAEQGVRILPLGKDGVLDIVYEAPARNPGPNGRTEYVAVHLATPDRQRGLHLGSAAIKLVPAT